MVADKISFVVGEGNRVLFWKDKWCGSAPLCEAYPNIFAIAANKNALVKEAWSLDEGRGKGGAGIRCSQDRSMI